MSDPSSLNSTIAALNSLADGLFLLTAFGMVATRQVKDCLQFFIAQALLLAGSAFLLGVSGHSWHLAGVGIVNLIAKPLAIPLILRRTTSREVYTRREIEQAVSIPTSLIFALALAILAYFLSTPVVRALGLATGATNVPVGIAGLLLGAYTLTARREAVPLLLALLTMENGAFLAGIAIAPNTPLLVELAVATDGLAVVFILGVLTRAVQEHVGTTDVGSLTALKEAAAEEVLP